MIKPRNTLLELRAVGSCCTAVLLGMACGSDDVSAPADVVDGADDVCESDLASPTCPGSGDVVVVPPVGGSGGGGAVEGDPPDPPSQFDLERAVAESVLRVNCGQCHGSDLEARAAQAGMNYIDDIQALIQNGKLVPLRPQESPIVQYMLDGTMPPPGVTTRPTSADIQTVVRFIENPDFWPGYEPPAPARDCSDQIIEFDRLYADVQSDLVRQDADDREFVRYLTLTNRYNAGICTEDLDPDRWAMNKLVNMLSIRAQISVPVAIDPEQIVYRVDIRRYGWDRPVSVNGEDFADGWEAIIASSPYAVPFVGDEAERIRADTGTDVPVMYADAALDVALLGNLYYALVGVDVEQSLDDFIDLDLGIDIAQNFEQERVVRAGTTQSDISRQDRVVERHEIEVRQGAYWQSFDFEADQDGESIFNDPFGFNQGGTEAIFTLQNGLLGFVIADAQGSIAEQSNILLDRFQDDFVARTAVSCTNCHAQGFNPVVDEVRGYVERNRLDFVADEYEAVLETYPTAGQLAAIIEADSLAFQQSLGRALVPIDERDPLSRIFVRFNLDMRLAAVAGDLGVRPRELSGDLNRLDPALRVVETLTIDRDDFSALFEASLCTMQGFSRNRPDPQRCDLALELIQ